MLQTGFMKTMLLLPLLYISFFLPPSLCGYEKERATANLATDFAQCSAFYLISAEAIRRTGDERLAIRFMEASRIAYDYSVNFGSQKVTQERIKSAVHELAKEIGHDYSNFPILTLKYAEMCKGALNSPKKRLQYWLDRKE